MGTQVVAYQPRFLAIRLIWRFCSGNFMDGVNRGDATWTRAARDPGRRLNGYTKMPRLQRAVIRWLACWYLVAIVFAFIYALWLGYFVVGLALAYALWRVGMVIERRLFHRTTSGRVKRADIQRRIDALPEAVAKLFGGKSE